MNWISEVLKSIETMKGLPFVAIEIGGMIILILFLRGAYILLRKLSNRYLYNKNILKIKDPEWDKAVKETEIVTVIGYLAVGFVLLFIVQSLFSDEHMLLYRIVAKFITIYFQISILILLNKALDIVIIVNASNPHMPLKGILQFLKITLNFFGILIIFAFFMGKEPAYFISALGIIASVLLIVFKDTILGLTASWQLAMNKMLYLGDWITMPQHNLDGEVTDISLTTVSVRNFDNTIICVPAYELISNSFQNWKGMQESGVRRIKRAIYIDIQSIKFMNKAMIDKLRKIELLRDYLTIKEKEISEINSKHDIASTMINGAGLTNIGTFRIYCEAYIKSKDFISKNHTAFARQLAIGSQGLPLEIYCFANTTVWALYEKYQSDIFDHLLAVMKEFELNVFQEISGNLTEFMSLWLDQEKRKHARAIEEQKSADKIQASPTIDNAASDKKQDGPL
jgi:miniconductance mechanosensitive channel